MTLRHMMQKCLNQIQIRTHPQHKERNHKNDARIVDYLLLIGQTMKVSFNIKLVLRDRHPVRFAPLKAS